jgi:hypothetical protein
MMTGAEGPFCRKRLHIDLRSTYPNIVVWKQLLHQVYTCYSVHLKFSLKYMS